MSDITEPRKDDDEPALVSHRTADIVVACLFLVASAIVIKDATRLGFSWRPNEGPAPGYFPFYIAVVMAISSAINLARAVISKAEADETLTTKTGVLRMSAIFVPALIYVFATSYIGIYVASAIYIAAFMYFFGKFPIWKSLAVALGISGVSFVMFEIWFLVPLPKGPIEAAFGF
ncbi:tripartite tricarboxylate transporter TctB family protein [Chenggangzhangella methanolivorans]|uniref:Tripartite tricarboxylate transporter TctB family protein n=1 Tax=Chenggangzhangella methanolivorans TaxID=1437009 RepID=A0A9E6UMC9_9HYPH|nr:tripartite tricarboxylate transporter TctB family protein [Chenggangzhangella methanolivorans]QZN99910.1 tripartite tricarboxylate transporter TctB family protein [Chenggangzhangella methanolivorans]